MMKVQGSHVSGLRFKRERESDCTKDNTDDDLDENWTGRTIFIVDKQHSSNHGTDQRRQRVESLNHRRVSWADVFDGDVQHAQVNRKCSMKLPSGDA